MVPQGRQMTPRSVLEMVESGEGLFHHEDRRAAVYRRRDGLVYALGLRYDRPLWQQCRYQFLGSVSLLREQLAMAHHLGVRERSAIWYLLTDLESATACFGSNR
jgi:hypothetical protein